MQRIKYPFLTLVYIVQCIASDATVQVMLSTSDGNFYGDIRSHERVSLDLKYCQILVISYLHRMPCSIISQMALSFGEYLDYASKFMDCDKKDKQSSEGKLLDGMQLYLAQVKYLMLVLLISSKLWFIC